MVEKGKNKKYYYSIILGVCTLLGLLVGVFLIIRPLYSNSQKITKEYKEKTAILDELKDKKAKLEELKSKEEQLKADAEKVEAALPQAKDVGRLFIEVDQVAKESSGSVKSVSEGSGVNSTPTSEGINKISYSVPASFPDYFKLKEFIMRTEQALRIVDISGLDMTTAQTGGAMDVKFTANTYVRK